MVRKYKRKTEDRWSKEDLLEALVSIKEAKLRINDAARQFGISRATLYRQYQKFIQSGARYDPTQFRTCGGNPILSRVEEDVLEKTIKDLREQGFTVNSTDIKRICFEYCDTNSIPNQFSQEKRMASDDWYYGFLKRHPELRVARPDGKGGSGSRTSEPAAASSASSGSTNPVQVIPSSSKVTSSEPILVPPEQGQLKKPLKRLGGGLKSAEAKKVAQDKAEEVDIDAILMGVVKREVEQEEEDDDDEGEQNQNEQMETEGDDEEDDDSEEFEEEEETTKAVEEDAEMAEEEEEQQEKEDSESDEEEEGDGNDKEAVEEEEEDDVDAEEDDETAEDMGEDELEEEEMDDNDEEDVDEEEAVEEEENDGNEEDEESEESESEDE